MNDANNQALLSAIRSVLMVLGSVLSTHGVIDSETMQSLVGAVMVILPFVWGMWDKHRSERATQAREVTAVQVGVTVANSTVGVAPMPAASIVPELIAAVAPHLPPTKDAS